jgi:tRNA U34 2-thiouridine synthase MnmA/TrmU
MSGGVDSSVAAALLKRRGYDVIGLTMQIWQESQTDPRHAGCCSLGAVEDARRVARVLDFPHYVMNFREEFRQKLAMKLEEFDRHLEDMRMKVAKLARSCAPSSSQNLSTNWCA